MRGEAKAKEHFLNKVDKKGADDCWLWKKSKSPQDYGSFIYQKKWWNPSRFMWFITNGVIPEGMYVCHKCDIPACCNPEHLFLGTPKDNMNDRDKKGRMRYQIGEASNLSKLTWKKVEQIREIYFDKTPKRGKLEKLAKMFSVHRDTIACIVKNRTWKVNLRRNENATN